MVVKMKKLLIVILFCLFSVGCTAKNGNSISKLETTIYNNNNHDELVIEDAFDYMKKVFTDEDTFYYSSLLTLEYGDNDTLDKEESIKQETNSYEVLYIQFSFKTGDVAYEAMESNFVYNYEVYLTKATKNADWRIYKMDQIR